QLTFFYDFTPPPAGSFFATLQHINFTAQDFAGVTTDVDGDAGINTLTALRSDDARSVTFQSLQQFDGATVPHLSIATDATAFDHAGSADVELIQSFKLAGSDPGDLHFDVAAASTSISELFEPARGATTIPLQIGRAHV